MKRLSFFLSVGLVVVGAMPVLAQQTEGGGSPGAVEHAEIGLLEAVGGQSHRIVIALPGETTCNKTGYQSYDTNDQTLVEGLGSVMSVNDALGEQAGKVVSVTYVDNGEHYVAKRVNFAEDEEIHQTRGTIQSTNPRDKSIVIQTAKGRNERVDLGAGAGALIDSDQGLIRDSDLRAGQEVTVYTGGSGVAYLLRVE